MATSRQIKLNPAVIAQQATLSGNNTATKSAIKQFRGNKALPQMRFEIRPKCRYYVSISMT